MFGLDASVLKQVLIPVTALIIATFTYWLTKRREREAEWRKAKIEFYKEFVESISGIVDGDSSDIGQRKFTQVGNNLLLFAPQVVFDAVESYRLVSQKGASSTLKQHDDALTSLMLAIREDIGLRPKDDPAQFSAKLWASGTKF